MCSVHPPCKHPFFLLAVVRLVVLVHIMVLAAAVVAAQAPFRQLHWRDLLIASLSAVVARRLVAVVTTTAARAVQPHLLV